MKSSLFSRFAVVLCIFAVASRAPAQQEAAGPTAPASALATWQRDLLQLAFTAASKFPLQPHIRNRSRAQLQVVDTCFELDAAELAVGFARDIADWRRGAAYADFATWCGRRGDRPRALRYLQLVDDLLLDEQVGKPAQEWQRDFVVLKQARAWAALGEAAKADAAMQSIDPDSTHAVDPDWARTAADRVAGMTIEQGRATFAGIDREFPAMTLGQQGTALETIASLHARFYADEALRRLAEDRLTRVFDKLPPKLRLDAITRLVRTAAANSDAANAQRLVADMQRVVEGFQWRAEDRVPELARIAELRCLAGLPDRGRAELDAALADYHEHRDEIVDIYRAATLRAVALAFFAIGELGKAHDLLASVFEEGMENPNSRPRCDDFVATCCLMARRGVEPRAAMWTRLREIVEGLGEPW
ncbi:MAG: hypothetical protein JNN13_18570 [Planctomycetes bacterium]|nr:hypothetical protein [Planctomycetota bacterium]